MDKPQTSVFVTANLQTIKPFHTLDFVLIPLYYITYRCIKTFIIKLVQKTSKINIFTMSIINTRKTKKAVPLNKKKHVTKTKKNKIKK